MGLLFVCGAAATHVVCTARWGAAPVRPEGACRGAAPSSERAEQSRLKCAAHKEQVLAVSSSSYLNTSLSIRFAPTLSTTSSSSASVSIEMWGDSSRAEEGVCVSMQAAKTGGKETRPARRNLSDTHNPRLIQKLACVTTHVVRMTITTGRCWLVMMKDERELHGWFYELISGKRPTFDIPITQSALSPPIKICLSYVSTLRPTTLHHLHTRSLIAHRSTFSNRSNLQVHTIPS